MKYLKYLFLTFIGVVLARTMPDANAADTNEVTGLATTRYVGTAIDAKIHGLKHTLASSSDVGVVKSVTQTSGAVSVEYGLVEMDDIAPGAVGIVQANGDDGVWGRIPSGSANDTMNPASIWVE